MEGFEKNRRTLEQALARLRSYAPAPNSWDAIQQSLESSVESEGELHNALEQLPAYAPPPEVWNKLTKVLDADQTPTPQLSIRKYIAIAASMLILIASAIWLLREAPPKVTLAYSQETVQQFGFDLNWEEDEGSFDRLEEELFANNDPTLNKLHLELTELNDARQEVKAILTSYGQDPKLITQLSDIERDRSDIYRQIIEIML